MYIYTNKTKIVFIIFLCIVAFALLALAYILKNGLTFSESPSTEKTPVRTGAVIEPQTVEYRAYDCVVPLEVRKITVDGERKSGAEKAIEDAFRAIVDDLDPIATIEDDDEKKLYTKISDFKQPITNDALTCSYYSDNARIVESYISRNFAAVEIESYSNWGGAHPNTYTTNVNVNLGNDRATTYDEYAEKNNLTKDRAVLKSVIRKALKEEELRENPQATTFISDTEPDAFSETDFPERQWRITPGGIVFNNLYYGHAAAGLRVIIPLNVLAK